MNPREIIDFLLPQWSDPIQSTFFIVIALMMAYAIGGAHYAARPSEWEKKWNRGTETTEDDLDIEHGSVTDLWHAVATSHEKLAEIMPGLLLVVGLLGTFLGLGLALNHASNILGQQDAASTSAAASSMNELMGMLKGLGTKFKTSTWGICGFVLLKIWSELTRFEEKRLVWVIDKVKLELHARRNKEEEIGAAKQKALFEEIRLAASTIETAVKMTIKSSTIHMQDFFGKRFSGLDASLTVIHSSNKESSDSMQKAVKDGINAATSAINESFNSTINASTSDTKMLLNERFSGLNESLAAIHSSNKESSNSMQKTMQGEIRGATSTINESFGSTISNSISEIQTFLGEKISGLNESLADIHSSSKKTSDSMAEFTQNTANIVRQMADAAQGMSSAAEGMKTGTDKVSDAAQELNRAVDDFSSGFTSVLNAVRTDLGSAISDMSEKSAETMASGSRKLEGATKEISAALESLSGDIKQTLGDVKGSIGESLEIQKNAFVLFETTSQTLNEQIQKSTQTANMMKDSIESGLQGVSGASRNVGLLSKQMEAVAKKLDDGTLSKVESLSKQIESQSKEIDVFLENIKLHVSEIDRMESGEAQTPPFEVSADS